MSTPVRKHFSIVFGGSGRLDDWWCVIMWTPFQQHSRLLTFEKCFSKIRRGTETNKDLTRDAEVELGALWFAVRKSLIRVCR